MKQNIKNILFGLVLIIGCSSMIIGCSKNNSATGGNNASSQSAPAKPTYTWTAALNVAETTINYKIVEHFKNRIEEVSKGAVVVNIYPNGQLGGDREMIEGLVNGSIDISSTITSGLTEFVPEFAVFDMPSVFTDLSAMRGLLADTEFQEKMNVFSKPRGIHMLGYSDAGFRQTTSNKLINSVADIRGLKIRVIQNPYHIEYWKQLGGNPLAMDFSEVFIGLQQGEIDAQENPYMNIVGNRFYEAQKYGIETNHLGHVITFLMNNTLYDGLPSDIKAMVDSCAKEAIVYGNQISDERIAADKKTCEDHGMQIITLPAAELEKMRAASEPVYKMVAEKVGNELVNFFLEKIK